MVAPEEAVKGAVLESAVLVLFPWVSYMLAESLQLSGIVSILFCGIIMGHYTRRNLSEGGRALTMVPPARTCEAHNVLHQPSFLDAFSVSSKCIMYSLWRTRPTAPGLSTALQS